MFSVQLSGCIPFKYSIERVCFNFHVYIVNVHPYIKHRCLVFTFPIHMYYKHPPSLAFSTMQRTSVTFCHFQLYDIIKCKFLNYRSWEITVVKCHDLEFGHNEIISTVLKNTSYLFSLEVFDYYL